MQEKLNLLQMVILAAIAFGINDDFSSNDENDDDNDDNDDHD